DGDGLRLPEGGARRPRRQRAPQVPDAPGVGPALPVGGSADGGARRRGAARDRAGRVADGGAEAGGGRAFGRARMSALDGQVAVVTGGGSGMGRGISARLARDGAAVVVVDVDPDAAAETVRLIE